MDSHSLRRIAASHPGDIETVRLLFSTRYYSLFEFDNTVCPSATKSHTVPKKHKRSCQANHPVEGRYHGAGVVVSHILEQIAAQCQPANGAGHQPA